MEKYESLGFTAIVTNNKLKVEIPINNLIDGFRDSPNNHDEVKVKRGYRREFVTYVAKSLIDQGNSESGDSFIMEALELVFEELFEGAEDFITYPEEGN